MVLSSYASMKLGCWGWVFGGGRGKGIGKEGEEGLVSVTVEKPH